MKVVFGDGGADGVGVVVAVFFGNLGDGEEVVDIEEIEERWSEVF